MMKEKRYGGEGTVGEAFLVGFLECGLVGSVKHSTQDLCFFWSCSVFVFVDKYEKLPQSPSFVLIFFFFLFFFWLGFQKRKKI
jgi:hypothetical protein